MFQLAHTLCSTCAKLPEVREMTRARPKCRYCGSVFLETKKEMTTGGVMTLLAGILPAPIVVGLILIFFALRMNHEIVTCKSCKRVL